MKSDNSNADRQEPCYLCGSPLSEKVTRDHVPPRQLYPTALRKADNPQLLTLRVHDPCNRSYQNDEDYFAYSMSPLAVRTKTGKAVLDGISDAHSRGRQAALMAKVRDEWSIRPSGLVLPPGMAVKRIEGDRIHRVVWKIVRGLFFHHEGRLLPESTPDYIEYVPPDERPPETFFLLSDQPNRGLYPEVFDYRYRQFREVDDLWYWALQFWGALIVLMAFHDPECRCDECASERSGSA